MAMTPTPRNSAQMYRWVAVALTGVLLAMPWWLPESGGEKPLRFGFSVWPGVEAAVIARGAGGLAGGKMRLMEAQWSSAITRAFDNDMIDVAALGLDGVLRLRDRGEKLLVVRVLDVSQEADAVVSKKGFGSMTALKGKRVGVDMAGTGGAVLAACLKRETMSLGNVEAVQLVQAEMVDALKDGAVDAAVVSEPWLTLLRESGYAVVSDAGRSGLPVVRVLVVKDAELALHAASLTALISVWDRPPPSAGQPGWEEVLRREGLSANQYRECLKMLRPVDRVENGVWLGGNSPKLEAISQQWEVILREAGIISERHLPNEPWFDDQFVKREVEK